MHIHNATIVADETTHHQQLAQDTHHLWKTVFQHENSAVLHLLAESGFWLQKCQCNLNICFYKHLLRHAWTWRPNTACSKQHSWFWPRFSKPCNHQAERSAATHFCMEAVKYSASTAGRLTSKHRKLHCQKSSQKCCFSHSKTTTSSQRKKKKIQNDFLFFFFKLQPSINWNMPCMEKPGKLPKPSSLQWEIKLPHQDMTHWNEETHQHLRWELLCLYKQGAGSGQTSGVSHELGKGFGDSSPTSR